MTSKNFKTANLKDAATYVQLSRKTLDDYFSMIRRGENYNFDFVRYMDQKMGLLRQHIKETEAKPGGKRSAKNVDIFQIWNRVNNIY